MQRTDRELRWTVVFAAFCAHFVTHGIIYTFGLLFLVLQETFHATKAEIAWINSICTGMLFLTGPVTSVLWNKYGPRVVMVTGSLLASLGYLLSIFVPSLHYLYFTMGIMGGGGFGLIFQSSVVVVTLHFKKHRTAACGLALSGCGIGGFASGPIMDLLLHTYSWRGTLLLMSALILNCIPFGLIYPSQEPRDNARRIKDLSEPEVELTLLDPQHVCKHTCGSHDTEREINTADNAFENVKEKGSNNIKVVIEMDENLMGFQTKTIKDVHKSELLNQVDETRQYLKERDNNKNNQFPDRNVCGKSWHCNFIQTINVFRSHYSFLEDFKYVLLVVSTFFFHAVIYQPFIFIPDRSKEIGIDSTATMWAVSTIGLASIFGRVVIAYIADIPGVNRLSLYILAMIVTGVSTALGPLYNTAWSLILYAVIYGVSIGVVITFISVVIVDILGLDRLSEAFGFCNFINGVGTLIGPPAAGIIHKASGGYDAPFVVFGVATTIGGVLLLMVSIRDICK